MIDIPTRPDTIVWDDYYPMIDHDIQLHYNVIVYVYV